MRLKYALRRCTGINVESWKVVITTTHREIMGSDCTEVSKDWDKLPIPIFHRVRTVTTHSSGRLYCDCGYSHRVGLPCRHTYAVICFECPDYEGPTAKDVSVNWWKSYCHLAYRRDNLESTSQDKLDRLFSYLSGIDIVAGPLMPTKNSQPKSSSEINIDFEQKTLLGCIVNYEEHNVKQILDTYGITKNFNGYNCQTHLAVNYEHIELFQNSWDAPCWKISSREKLKSSLSELLAVVDCCDNETEGEDTVNTVWKQINKATVALRVLSFAKKSTGNLCSSVEVDDKEKEDQQWVSMTQERENKRSRQFVSSNGLR